MLKHLKLTHYKSSICQFRKKERKKEGKKEGKKGKKMNHGPSFLALECDHQGYVLETTALNITITTTTTIIIMAKSNLGLALRQAQSQGICSQQLINPHGNSTSGSVIDPFQLMSGRKDRTRLKLPHLLQCSQAVQLQACSPDHSGASLLWSSSVLTRFTGPLVTTVELPGRSTFRS